MFLCSKNKFYLCSGIRENLVFVKFLINHFGVMIAKKVFSFISVLVNTYKINIDSVDSIYIRGYCPRKDVQTLSNLCFNRGYVVTYEQSDSNPLTVVFTIYIEELPF